MGNVHINAAAFLFMFFLHNAIQAQASPCPVGCQCSFESDGAFLEKWICEEVPVQLTSSVKYLDIIKKNQTTLTVDKLSNFQHVEVLNFTGLGLDSIITEYPHTVFNLYNIKMVYLAKNSFRRLNSTTLQWCPSALLLDLSDNAIKNIEHDTFTNTKTLRVLNLANNNIVSLTFDIPASLVSLDLSHNHLENSMSIPRHLITLQSLNICGNGYFSIASSFPRLPQLTRLCLGDAISSFEPNSLSSLENLTHLEIIGKCDLNETAQHELGVLRNLKFLRLAYVKLPSISSEMFQGLASLQQLHLVDIQSDDGFGNVSFVNMDQIQLLNLHNSPSLTSTLLQTLETIQLPSLQNLIISGTNTSIINEEVLSNLPNLETLDISENPLACDGNLKALTNAIVSKRISLQNPEGSKCSMPVPLANNQLTDCSVIQHIMDISSKKSTVSNDTVTRSDGIHYYLDKWGITTDHLLYALFALTILLCLLVTALLIVACCSCKKKKYKKHNNDSSESFALRADNEYTFDNFTHVDIVRRSPLSTPKPIPTKRK